MKPTPPVLADLSDDEFSRRMARALHERPDAPPALQRAAIDLWPAPVAGLQALAAAALRTVVAVLTFDSWVAAAAPVGMRSLRSATRHLLFSAEGRDIDLRIRPEAEAYALTGQIVGPDTGGTVEVQSAGATGVAHQAVLDELGEFRLDGLAAGRYTLTLQLGEDRVVLPGLQVGEQLGDAAG